MPNLIYSDETFDNGQVVEGVRVYDDGTVAEVAHGKVVRTRAATADEQARADVVAAGPTPSTEERIATLEADLAVAKEQAAKADALQAVLLDKGVIAEADVIAAPVEEVAIKR